MDHTELIAEAAELEAAAKAAAAPLRTADELRTSYEQLRARAAELNRRQGLATAHEFATVLPTVEDLALIERLDAAIAGDTHPAVDAESRRLIDGLGQIHGWAAGVRMAYETLDWVERD
jgi:hypothetical protein